MPARPAPLLACLAFTALAIATVAETSGQPAATASDNDLVYIDTAIENASPLWYERAEDGSYHVHLIYDHERGSPNRAAGHVHFALDGRPGATITLEFKNLDNVWNGQPGSVAAELTAMAVSADGRSWTRVPTTPLPGGRIRLTVTLEGPRLYIARLEPYRVSDLEVLLKRVRARDAGAVTVIGATADGRPLPMIHLGNPQGAGRLFIRARAHPWESGSSWVAEGLVDRLLRDDAATRALLERIAVDVLPMANIDGVARGRTRFNGHGTDLNRNWDRPADPDLAPENAALERWLVQQIQAGRSPDLAIELHNDGRGLLHISRPPIDGLPRHLERMALLERLLRAGTWFTEGHTEGTFRNSGTLGDGWLQRYGIDALVHEFNANWIEGLTARPTAAHWRAYGAALPEVFEAYLRERTP